MMSKSLIKKLILAAILWMNLTAFGQGFDHSHAKWGVILSAFTTNGLVSYEKLQQHPARLKVYLSECAKVTTPEFEGWSTNQQKSFLINLYNASLVEMIVDRYPVTSVKQIGNFYKGPFKQEAVVLFGERTTFEQLERTLSERYHDIRVFFSLATGAKSGPSLLGTPYLAESLDDQLTFKTKHFLANKSKNVFEPAKMKASLSLNLKSMNLDLPKNTSPLKALAPYLPPQFQEMAKSEEIRIGYLEYDWGLNQTDMKTAEVSK